VFHIGGYKKSYLRKVSNSQRMGKSRVLGTQSTSWEANSLKEKNICYFKQAALREFHWTHVVQGHCSAWEVIQVASSKPVPQSYMPLDCREAALKQVSKFLARHSWTGWENGTAEQRGNKSTDL